MQRARSKRRILAIMLTKDFELPVLAKRHRSYGGYRRTNSVNSLCHLSTDYKAVSFFLVLKYIRLIAEIRIRIRVIVKMIHHEIREDRYMRAYRKIAEPLQLPRIKFENDNIFVLYLRKHRECRNTTDVAAEIRFPSSFDKRMMDHIRNARFAARPGDTNDFRAYSSCEFGEQRRRHIDRHMRGPRGNDF